MSTNGFNLNEIYDKIRNNRERVIWALWPELNGRKIDEDSGNIVIDESLGNPKTKHLIVRYNVEGKSYLYSVRAYLAVPQAYRAKVSPIEKDYRVHEFLRRAGVCVPKSVYFPEISDLFFTEHLDGDSLKSLLMNKMITPREVLDSASFLIKDFSEKVRGAMKDLSEEQVEILFWSRTPEEQAENYIITFGEHRTPKAEPSEIKNVIDAYKNIFVPFLKGEHPSHGDMSPGNLVLLESTGRMHMIDPELKKDRSRFADLGSLCGYMGVNHIQCGRISGGMFVQKGYFPRGVFRSSKNPADFLEWVSNEIHPTLRLIAKKQGDSSGNYVAQQISLGQMLEEIRFNPRDFGLNQEKQEKVQEIYEFFKPEEKRTMVSLFGNPVTSATK